MPELPEVETIRRELAPKLAGRKITGCAILRPDIIGHPSPPAFKRGVIGKKIVGVDRRAKYLIIKLDHGVSLIIHLRLSGALIFRSVIDPALKYARLIFELGRKELVFAEPRVLGRAYLLKSGERPNVLDGFFNLSHEPICREFDSVYFKNAVKHRRAPIKNLLLDQKIIAGIGNIYADEALFRAGIRPSRRANTLRDREIALLARTLKEVLLDGIKHCGTTVSDYKRSDGRSGNFQKLLNVYARENEPCKICGSSIVYKKIGNRGARYCPKCQK
jgi:formamidopyrimidine-DNA glycosylase